MRGRSTGAAGRSAAGPGPARRTTLVAAALSAAGVLTSCTGDGPGEDAARQVAQDYLDARIADGCGHYAYYSEAYARAEHVDVKDCQADEQLEAGEYVAYEIEAVRVDGDAAEVDVADESDAPSGPFTLVLGVEDGRWRIDELVRHESDDW